MTISSAHLIPAPAGQGSVLISSPTNQKEFKAKSHIQEGSVFVVTPAICSWTVWNTNDWITLTSGSGIGNGLVTYSVTANANRPRFGIFSVGGRLYTVVQQGLPQPGQHDFTADNLPDVLFQKTNGALARGP